MIQFTMVGGVDGVKKKTRHDFFFGVSVHGPAATIICGSVIDLWLEDFFFGCCCWEEATKSGPLLSQNLLVAWSSPFWFWLDLSQKQCNACDQECGSASDLTNTKQRIYSYKVTSVFARPVLYTITPYKQMVDNA